MRIFDNNLTNDINILLICNIYFFIITDKISYIFPDPAGQDPFLTEGYIIISSVASYAFG